MIVSTQPPDGNRWYRGRGSVTEGEPLRLELGVTPAWLGGVAADDRLSLGVVANDGSILAFEVTGGTATPRPSVGRLDDPLAPVSFVFGGELEVVPHVTASRVGVVAVDGQGATIDDAAVTLSPLPDGVPVVDPERGLIAVLTDPTDRYPHAVLGDALESGSVTVVDATTTAVTAVISFPDDLVAEATSAMWVDVAAERGLLVTVSDRRDGARLIVYGTDGSVVAQSDPIGLGNRWRHQIGAAPIGPGGEYEIVDVRTPHLGGVVEFFRVEGDRLERRTAVEGLTSHGIGSRNLDWMAIVDADGDGTLEVVGPTQDRSALGAVVRTGGGAEVEWTIPLPDRMSTNLMVAPAGHGAWIGLGTADGTVLLWPPRP